MVAFAWVSLGPVLLLYLIFSASATAYTYFLLWATGLLFDFYTTYRFYMADPENFERNELSRYMRCLYRIFGFKAGLSAFLVFVELPIGLIISLLLVPASAMAFNLPIPETVFCLASGFAFLGIGHFAAAVWNLLLERRTSPP